MLFGESPFDLEVSVDETDVPTSPLEHFFIASELKRLGIQVQGLAPRFVGEFEKAVDYIGDLEEFEKAFRSHALIAKFFGYKLSIHSGSDKFSIYPIMAKLAGDLIHLKTAGTSYLEALRIVARHNPSLFREIVKHSFSCFEKDRKTYHVSTRLSAIPNPDEITNKDLEKSFLDDDNGRQLLHVTFGSILTAERDGKWVFRDRIKKTLIDNEEEYCQTLAKHFGRHIKVFGRAG
jgi:mRNA-degrading endonuclease YafQ of YafQ-DinJ toxin-antitoxin module